FPSRCSQGPGTPAATLAAAQVAYAHSRVAIPAQRDEDMFRHPTGDGHGCALQSGHWTGATHVDGDRVAQVFDAEICGKMFGRGRKRRGDNAVDVVRGEPRVGDGR